MTIDMTVQYLNFIQCNKKAQISRSKDLPMQLPATSVWFQSSILWHGNQNNTCVIPQSLIQFYPESGIQINKCTTVNIYEHGTNQQV